MSEVIRNVADIDSSDRQALEHMLGANLTDDQQVIISVVSRDACASKGPGAERPVQSLDDWTHVYDGLSDDEVEAVDAIAKTRADLTRDFP
jgi:hypothetical protein